METSDKKEQFSNSYALDTEFSNEIDKELLPKFDKVNNIIENYPLIYDKKIEILEYLLNHKLAGKKALTQYTKYLLIAIEDYYLHNEKKYRDFSIIKQSEILTKESLLNCLRDEVFHNTVIEEDVGNNDYSVKSSFVFELLLYLKLSKFEKYEYIRSCKNMNFYTAIDEFTKEIVYDCKIKIPYICVVNGLVKTLINVEGFSKDRVEIIILSLKLIISEQDDNKKNEMLTELNHSVNSNIALDSFSNNSKLYTINQKSLRRLTEKEVNET